MLSKQVLCLPAACLTTSLTSWSLPRSTLHKRVGCYLWRASNNRSPCNHLAWRGAVVAGTLSTAGCLVDHSSIAFSKSFSPWPSALLGAPQAQLTRRLHNSRMLAVSEERGGSSGKAIDPDTREILVQHVLLEENQLQELLKLQTRIVQEGVDLSDMAAEFSRCPSKKNGGMLGWIQRGQTVPEFEEASFSAPLNKLVRVKTKFGWHLLQVLSERESVVVQQMTVEELQSRLVENAEQPDHDEKLQLVDVREPGEAEMASLPGFKLYPLSQFGRWGPIIEEELDLQRETIVLCHHGVRSQQMADWLRSKGFKTIYNVVGGIDAYSQAVDSSVPRY